MEGIWIALTFLLGLSFKTIKLPPLIGYLIAGYVISYFNIGNIILYEQLANLGVTLLLFLIGLKLKLKDLIKHEVFFAGSLHLLGITTIIFIIISGLAFILPEIISVNYEQTFTIAFILSFSSTICVLKILQESGESNSRHGRLCISILVVQDIIAVLFMVYATKKIPTIGALFLPLLFFIKPLLYRILNKVGHCELLALMGIALAFSGYQFFEYFNVKGDLGALLIGLLLSNHKKTKELEKSLLNFKDLFLIGFFLSIGMIGVPVLDDVIVAVFLSLLLPIKFLLFFILFAIFKLRSRTSYLNSTLLTNYGEFGLIITFISVNSGILNDRWLIILGLVVAISLIINTISYHFSHRWFTYFNTFLERYETKKILDEDVVSYPKNINYLVVGSGRVGSSALRKFNYLNIKNVWGIDSSNERVKTNKEKGLDVFLGDAEDISFWSKLEIENLQMVLLAVPSIEDCLTIVEQLKKINYQGKIVAVVHFEEDRRLLRKHGVDAVFNVFKEAGAKFAEDSLDILNYKVSTNKNS